MQHLPAVLIGDAYTSTYAWNLLEEIVAIRNRMAGQDGEKRGTRLIEREFSSIGLKDVSTTEFEIPGWGRGDTTLDILQPEHTTAYTKSHEIVALSGTPAGEVKAELVDVGSGTPEDFEKHDIEGTIVMASSSTPEEYDRRVSRIEKYRCAADAGAVGFVFRNDRTGCHPLTGEIGWNKRPGLIPAIGVSAEVGLRLERILTDNFINARLRVDCRNEPTISRNVEGVLGPKDTREVLVTAHIDAHDISEGAADNAIGSALVVELGRLLAHIKDKLDTRIRFVIFGAEEAGLHGSKHWSKTHNLNNVKCMVNIDGPALSRSVLLRTNKFKQLKEIFENVCEDLDMPIVLDKTVNPNNDSWSFTRYGVPAVMAGSKTDESTTFWGHTHADTLDKLNRHTLRDFTICFGSVVTELTNSEYEIPRKSEADIRKTIDKGTELALRACDRWPYT